MPKSSKRFILSNEKLNSHGFRVITSGIDLTGFMKNPIMYWMHDYPKEGDWGTGLPIGYWTDIKVIGSELSAIPVFNDSDDFAMKIFNMVEHGTIRAASVAIDPISLDTNKANWMPGQKLPTLLKSRLDEASIVDRGSNSDAVALSLNSSKLSFLKYQLNTTMEARNLKPTENNQVDEHTPETKAIFKNAVECGKFTQDAIDHLAKLTTNDPEILLAMKGVIKKASIKPENITCKFHHTLITQAANKSYDEINQSDCQLRNMKANAPELYKAKFFEKFGRLPADVA